LHPHYLPYIYTKLGVETRDLEQRPKLGNVLHILFQETKEAFGQEAANASQVTQASPSKEPCRAILEGHSFRKI
jgi:hypothetical protein